MAHHPHRLPRSHYVGRRTHFLTACTYFRRELLRNHDACTCLVDQLLRASTKHGFENIAYVPMPDHVHALVKGNHDDSDFLKWLALFRQLSGYAEKQRSGLTLWQEGYWDYTLRDDESIRAIASYIVWNPVVAKLVERPEQYRYTGSDRFTIQDLAATPPTKPRVGDI